MFVSMSSTCSGPLFLTMLSSGASLGRRQTARGARVLTRASVSLAGLRIDSLPAGLLTRAPNPSVNEDSCHFLCAQGFLLFPDSGSLGRGEVCNVKARKRHLPRVWARGRPFWKDTSSPRHWKRGLYLWPARPH